MPLDLRSCVVDMLGLADPLTGHRRLDVRGIPGHEKSASGPWLVARLARAPSLVLPNGLDAAGPLDPPVMWDLRTQSKLPGRRPHCNVRALNDSWPATTSP